MGSRTPGGSAVRARRAALGNEFSGCSKSGITMHDPLRGEQRVRVEFHSRRDDGFHIMRAIIERRRVEAQGLVDNCVEIGEFFEVETSAGRPA